MLPLSRPTATGSASRETMADILVVGIYVVLGAAVGYALFLAGKEFLSGVRAALQERAGVEPAAHSKDRQKGAKSRASDDQTSSHAKDEHAHPPQDRQTNAPKPWHVVLDVHPGATIAEIQAAYRRKINLYHPDRVADLGQELRDLADLRAKEINAAYSLARSLRTG
jgi:hypothetical protein